MVENRPKNKSIFWKNTLTTTQPGFNHEPFINSDLPTAAITERNERKVDDIEK